MCSQCDDPDEITDEDLDELRTTVRTHLWAVKCVESARRPYAYTLGLHELGLPELLATGVVTERALALMDYFAPEAILNGTPSPGDRIVLTDTAMFEAVEVDHPDAHMELAVKLYGPNLRAVQLVWTDDYGRWPWDAAFDFFGMKQPVLGIRAQNA
jgi:hypothetical protein